MSEHQRIKSFQMKPITRRPVASPSDHLASDTYQQLSSVEIGRTEGTSDLDIDHYDQQSSQQDQVLIFYHRDFLKRPYRGLNQRDKFLNPYNGTLCDLVVQSSDQILNSESKARWLRVGIRNGSPWLIRLSNWALSCDHGSPDNVKTHIPTAALRWIPACIAILVAVSPNMTRP